MIGSQNIVLYVPLVIHAFLESGPQLIAYIGQINHQLAQKAKHFLEKGLERRKGIIESKSDIEIWLGIYLILVWFLRKSHIFSILCYWQLLRIKYMMGGSTKPAFKRFDRTVLSVANNPQCPLMIKQGHSKLREALIGMGDLTRQRIQHPIVRNCAIF